MTKKALNTNFAGGKYSFVYNPTAIDEEKSDKQIFKQQKITPIVEINQKLAKTFKDYLSRGEKVILKIQFDLTLQKSNTASI